MWDCAGCGTRRIAASIISCPKCRKERDMARATTGGASNANAMPGETGYIEPEDGPQAPSEAPAPVPAAGPVPVPVPVMAEPVKPGQQPGPPAVTPAKATAKTTPPKTPDPAGQ
jgi:hypothetical protein